MQLHPVPPEHVPTVFSILPREVESIAARSNGRFEVPDLMLALVRLEMFAWVVVDEQARLVAVVLAEVRDYPRAKVCRLVGCAGRDRKKWLPLLAVIEHWAASIGCTQMHAEARKGWAGELPDYRLTHVLLEKDLGNVQRRIEDLDGDEQSGPVDGPAAVPVRRVPEGPEPVQRRAP